MRKKNKYRMIRVFEGSYGWLIFWILVFWPIAIYYFLIRIEEVTVQIK